MALFDAGNPLAVRYDYDPNRLLDNGDVQALLADASLLSLAQEYLGSAPIADVLSMWWHTNYHKQPDSMAAQFFHFDMDRIKWLKVFIYLTDVGPENGPHSFVSGSHRTGGIPTAVLRKGYARLTDEEVHDHYPAERCLQLCAPRGSIIVEDTRGLHKGQHVTGAPRLMLQLQFSNSIFGTTYPRARISQVRDPGLQRMLEVAPRIYSQYT
jgi:ectoine hydroxylase-related dioxygenase (phytanoyl-CoA dioxygenase family)